MFKPTSIEGQFYKRAIVEPLTMEEEDKFVIFKTLAPLAKRLKVRPRDMAGFRVKKDLFDLSSEDNVIFPEEELPDPGSSSKWLDKDFAFQLAYEMEDLKSLKWYEHIVERCDRLKERQILLRAKGEVKELKDTEEEPENKGAYFGRLIRKYAEQRNISLARYGRSFKGGNRVLKKREIIKRKRKATGKLIAEIKATLSIDELCYYHNRAMEVINKECGKFFYDNEIDIPAHIIKSYVNKVIADDYKLKLPSCK